MTPAPYISSNGDATSRARHDADPPLVIYLSTYREAPSGKGSIILTVRGHDEQLRRVPVGRAVGGRGRTRGLPGAGGVRTLQAVVQLAVTDLPTAQGSSGCDSLLS